MQLNRKEEESLVSCCDVCQLLVNTFTCQPFTTFFALRTEEMT
jgi:hypothetical protein